MRQEQYLKNLSAMFSAAEYDDWETVFYFLDKGYPVDILNPFHLFHWPLLRYACMHNNKEAYFALKDVFGAELSNMSQDVFCECIAFEMKSLTIKNKAPLIFSTGQAKPMGVSALLPESCPVVVPNKLSTLAPIGSERFKPKS